MNQKTTREYSICTHAGCKKITAKEAARLLKLAKAHDYKVKLIYTHYWDQPYGNASASYFVSKTSKKRGISSFMLDRVVYSFPI